MRHQTSKSIETASSQASSLEWDSLDFRFRQPNFIFLSETDEGGNWTEGAIEPFHTLSLSPASAVLNYGQSIFEGMKAVRTERDRIVLFRPFENARRFRKSAARLAMPPYPIDWFMRAVQETVRAEAMKVPPHTKGSLYIRPVMIGSGPVLGVNPASSYTLFIFACPVGAYMPGDGRLIVLDSTHRVAPSGTGDIKASANYAGTLLPHKVAVSNGYKDVLYLDARHDKFVEEAGSSNFVAILTDGTLVTPRQGSILPGITRDSVLTIAREIFGWRVVERDLTIDEVLTHAKEAFLTGTAAVVQPVTGINYCGADHLIGSGRQGDQTEALRICLEDIQTEKRPDPFGWIFEIVVQESSSPATS